MDKKVKPNKTSFIYFNFVVKVLAYFVLTAILYSFGQFFNLPIYFFLGIFSLISTFSYVNQKIKYKKREYIFRENRIVEKGGGIFSDYETELVIKNITHVDLKLPFIKYNLFKTGSIRVESAGGGGTEIHFHDLNNSMNVYDYVKKLMVKNGFDLSREELIQTEKPRFIPVVMEALSRSTLFIFIILWFSGFLGGVGESLNPFVLGGIFSILFILFLLTYFNLKRRVYNVYSEVITYSKEFLSKEYSLIPIENLADASIKQSFLNKLFGFYDATISCQGAGQEIKFKNIANGELLEENIDKLIEETESLVSRVKEIEKTESDEEEEQKRVSEVKNDFTGTYKMNMLRSLATSLIFIPALPVFVIIVIFRAIKVRFTTYKVKKKSISEKYNFLTQKSVEFTNDKITGVVFKENLIDKLFNTYSILFWSIGSNKNIEFKNLKKDSELSEAIFEKLGVEEKEKIYQSNSTFSFLEAIKANIYLLFILALIGLGLLFFESLYLAYYAIGLVLISGLAFVYRHFYYQRSKLKLFNQHAYFQRGIFFQEHYYVLYEDVKDIETTKYPFSSFGSIKFNVAGEELKRQGKQQVTISHHFKINYVPKIETKDDLLDQVFHNRLSKEKAREVEEKIEDYKPETKKIVYPDLGNSIVKSIILFPIIPIVIWWVRRKSYLIQDYRVVYRRGILFRKQTSIVFNKIDHIDYRRGVLNKIFKNGDVLVNTVGSSTVEFKLKDISNFMEFYDLLESNYKDN